MVIHLINSSDGFIVDSDYAADNIYYAVNKICELTGKSKIDVLGWSWGTVTTSRFASNHPETVDKLILYAPIVCGIGESNVDTDYHKNAWNNAASDFQVKSDGTIDEEIVEQTVVEYFARVVGNMMVKVVLMDQEGIYVLMNPLR